MAKKDVRDRLRARYMESVKGFLAENGEEILVTGSNEIALPCVDENGDDDFCVITFKMPNGSRDGDPYDGYSVADAYRLKLKDKAEKAEKAARAKAEKIERDRKFREEKARQKAEREKREKGEV